MNIFGLILKNKMAAMGVSLSVMKSAFISPLLLIFTKLMWYSGKIKNFVFYSVSAV